MPLDPEGGALVCNQNGWVVRVDLATGEQTLLNSSSGIGWCEGLSADASGSIVVADCSGDAIVEVDPTSGAMTSRQPGGPFITPIDVAHVDADTLVLTDDGSIEVYRIDLASGAREPISRGQYLSRPRGVAVAPDGAIYVADVDGAACCGSTGRARRSRTRPR